MRAVAYCRVSTNKEEQLDSLESQQKFFAEYAVRNEYTLIRIYADEGKSGTKMKNRTQLLKLLQDAENGLFDVVLIKDISRLARNTVDFLTSLRKLKALNIRVIFVNYDQTSSDSSEFMLTMLSAIAQEESANTSKRVRFGKKQNARQGKVPNLVFGYDKRAGDYFNLTINEKEAEIVYRIFIMYTQKNIGAGAIAAILNREGITTKRGCKWTQNAVCRILSNEIYIGKVVNGKQEIEDFLTGKRKNMEKGNWMIVNRPEFRIIEDEIFYKAEEIRKGRNNQLSDSLKGKTGKYGLSGLIICSECGSFYRRLVRNYKNTSVKWVCNGRNSKGINYCSNRTAIEESDFLAVMNQYYLSILKERTFVLPVLMKEFNERNRDNSIRNKERDFHNKNDENYYLLKLNKLAKEKEKYIEMYATDIITLEELKKRTEYIKAETINCKLELELILAKKKQYDVHTDKEEFISSLEQFLEYLISSYQIMNLLIQKIVVEKDGVLHVYLKKYSKSK